MKSKLKFSKDDYLFNISQIKKKLKNKKLCLVLKSDCYGFGYHNILPLIIDKIDYIAILENEEAEVIRKYSQDINILRLRPASESEIKEGLKYQINEIIDSSEKMNIICKKYSDLPIHLSIDSGMNNIGIKIDKINFSKLSKLNLKGIFTHYSDIIYDTKFENNFDILYHKLKKINPKLIGHKFNSKNFLKNMDNIKYDMIRIGNLPYGMIFNEKLSLKPVLTWQTEYINIRTLNCGETLGYSSLFKAIRKTKVLIIPIGYYDGYPIIENSNQFVMVNNIKSKVIGKVSMNMIHVDITDIELPIKSIFLLGNGILLDDIKSEYYHNGYIIMNIVRNNKVIYD